MYRRYEDPYKLQQQLDELIDEREKETDEDRLIWLAIDIEEMKERINFAWQDDEYDHDYC